MQAALFAGMTNDSIGQILLTSTGHGVSTFDAVIDPRAVSTVAVGDTVVASGSDGDAVGVVTDLRMLGEHSSALSVANRSPVSGPSLVAETREALVATVQVFNSAALRPVSSGTLRHAGPGDIAALCHGESLNIPVPAGVVDLVDGSCAPVTVDGDELLGPLAAHLIAGGRSGAAAKTSYVTVLLRAAMASLRRADVSCAAVLFNVKGPDLLTLDEPAAAGTLTDADVAAYEALGVEAGPFADVTVYAAATPGGTGVNSSRTDAVGVRWGLHDMWAYLRYLDARLTDTDNAYALVSDLGDRKVASGSRAAKSLNELCAWLNDQIAEAEDAGRSEVFGNHHIATARKVARSLAGLPGLTKGLVAAGNVRGSAHDIPTRFRDGQVVVVDVEALEPRVQAAVIARTCTRLLAAAAAGSGDGPGLGVDRLVVFADELNVFAPNSGGEVPRSVRDILSKVAATGRYAGISLWGAAQFPSQVAGQIRDNASVTVLGATADTELDSGAYGRLPGGVREQMVTLKRGSMMLRAANLRSWTPIRFPRPAWNAGGGTSGLLAAKHSYDAGLSQASLTNLSEGVDDRIVAAVVAEHDGDTGKVVAALEGLREPDMRRVAPEPSSVWSPDRVWDLDD